MERVSDWKFFHFCVSNYYWINKCVQTDKIRRKNFKINEMHFTLQMYTHTDVYWRETYLRMHIDRCLSFNLIYWATIYMFYQKRVRRHLSTTFNGRKIRSMMNKSDKSRVLKFSVHRRRCTKRWKLEFFENDIDKHRNNTPREVVRRIWKRVTSVSKWKRNNSLYVFWNR